MTVFGLIVIGIIAREILRTPALHRLRVAARRERHRNEFGKLRTQLLMLVVSGASAGKRSRVFPKLYPLLTTLMRHPDRYGEAARILLRPPPQGDLPPSDLEPPSHAEIEVLLGVAHALDDMVVEHVPLWPWLQRLNRWSTQEPLWLGVQARRTLRAEALRARPLRDAKAANDASRELLSLAFPGRSESPTAALI